LGNKEKEKHFFQTLNEERKKVGRNKRSVSGMAWTLAPGTACGLIPAYSNRYVFSRK